MEKYKTLVEALQSSVKNGKGIRFLNSSTDKNYVTYKELLKYAKEYLEVFQRIGIHKGDEVVLQFTSLQSFVTALWACFLGGIIPLPLSYPDNKEKILKLYNIWKIIKTPWLATDSNNLIHKLEVYAKQHSLEDEHSHISTKLFKPAEMISPDKQCKIYNAKPEDIAFVQFSSGSTSLPKGVVLTHENLLNNIYSYCGKCRIVTDDIFLSWMPLSHDFGMIAFHLAPIILGSEQNLMPTNLFIINPLFWFRAVNEYRPNILGSPNFGMHFSINQYKDKICKEDNWDLSCVKTILNGAEPISKNVVEKFNRKLGKWGLCEKAMTPVYGLAEATLIVSICDSNETLKFYTIDRTCLSHGHAIIFTASDSPSAMEVVDCGVPIDETLVRITDADRNVLEECVMGNIEVKGECVTSGYYESLELTRSVKNDDGWLNTQDMGFLYKGRLICVGRVKEMIIIDGVNYFPQDIEKAILKDLSENMSNQYVACGLYNPEIGTEELIVFSRYKDDLLKFLPIIHAVKEIVYHSIGIKVSHVLPIKQIPKTTSGKIQRFKLIQLYRDGEFDSIIKDIDILQKQTNSKSNIVLENKLVKKNKSKRKVDEIIGYVQAEARDLIEDITCNVDIGFMDLGFNSMKLLELQNRMENRLGIKISNSAALDYPTIRKISEYIYSIYSDINVNINDKKTLSCNSSNYDKGYDSGNIAVVGMACRFPGKSNNLNAFWNLLINEVDAISEISEDRWMNDPYAMNYTGSRRGGFLEQIDMFDPLFFGISNKEAESLDPQHRLILELSWEAFEDAGWNPKSLFNSNTGVFVGLQNNDYLQTGRELGHIGEPYSFTGNMLNCAAGRISYTFGLQGPSMAIDTACSSSLVAVYQAMLHLRSHKCDIALASAVNIIMNSQTHQSFSSLQALSPNGRCSCYDEAADGYVRSEGAAVLILKRLEDAIKDGDSIWGIIRGAAVNHNGASSGFTVPNGLAQQKVIKNALEDAGLNPCDIDYIEGHGSGTKIGDPQEVNALAEVFKDKPQPLYLGCVKSNIGHLEAAAGMAGLIKILLSMHNEIIPPNLHYKNGNSAIDWEESNMKIVTKEIGWKKRNGVRRAGITSLGISGINSHLIVESYENSILESHDISNDTYPFTISANSEPALREFVKSFLDWVAHSKATVAEICQVLNISRTSLKRRFAFPIKFNDTGIIIKKLEKLYSSSEPIGVEIKKQNAPIVFLFSGQGCIYENIAKQLYIQSTVFKRSLQVLDAEFKKRINVSIIDLIYSEAPVDISKPLYAQPITFSIQVALVDFWESLGIIPDYLIGHSIGEYAAAYIDGVMSLEDAVFMVVNRARIIENNTTEGKMINLFTSESSVNEIIKDYDNVAIAAVNAAENITISGNVRNIEEITNSAKKLKIFVTDLGFGNPFHTPQMLKQKEELAENFSKIAFKVPTDRYISSVTGRLAVLGDEIDGNYWGKHIAQPVLFEKAMQYAYDANARIFIEIGGAAILSGFAEQNYEKKNILALPSLREKRTDWEQVSDALCQLWQAGVNVNWQALYSNSLTRLKGFPHTPYERNKIWYANDLKPSIILSPANNTKKRSDEMEIIEVLSKMITRISGLEIAAADNIFEVGFDSLMVLQLRRLIKEQYNLDIPTNNIFIDLQTIEALTRYIVNMIPPTDYSSDKDSIEYTNLAEGKPITQYIQKPNLKPKDSVLQGLFNKQLEIMEKQLQILANGIPLVECCESEQLEFCKDKAKNIDNMNTKLANIDHKSMNNDFIEKVRLNKIQSDFVNDFIRKRVKKTKKSKEYAAKYKYGLVDWVTTLNFDENLKEITYPVVAENSEGAYFWDIDGNKYIDTCMSYGAAYFGHKPKFIIDTLRKQLDRGFVLGPQSSDVGEVANLIKELANVDRVAFSNTGTEAVMASIRAARAVSKRNKIVRFTNSFHGTFDGVLVEGDGENVQPMSPGITQPMVQDTIVLTYGTDDSIEYIKSMSDQLAAVLVEPIQSRNPSVQPKEFLNELRTICTQHGIALIFDETLTGFRVRLGGAQEFFGIKADIATFGKLVAGGMPIGIITGKDKYLDIIDGGSWSYEDDSTPLTETIVYGGTYCKHPLSMATCKEVLQRLKTNGREYIENVSNLTNDFVQRSNDLFHNANAPIKILHFGSTFRFQSLASTDMQMLPFELNMFYHLLMDFGVYVWERRVCNFSTEHTKEDIDNIIKAFQYSIEALRSGGFSFKTRDGSSNIKKMKHDRFALSAEERGVYVLSNLKGGNEAYQIHLKFRVEGSLDYTKLKKCFNQIEKKHDMLRGCYRFENGMVVHNIVEQLEQDCMYVDLREEGNESKFHEFWERPMHLKYAPLWRWALVTDHFGNDKLYLNFHHIIADGGSINVIMQDLSHAYINEDFSNSSLPYHDYVAKQNDYLKSDQFYIDKDWWLKQYPTLPSTLNLPQDEARLEINEFRGATTYFTIQEELFSQIKDYSFKSKSTVFTFLLAAWTSFLGRLSGQEDLCVGFPMDGRRIEDFTYTVGMFAKTIVVRVKPEFSIKFSEYLNEVKGICYEAYDHSNYPLDILIKDLNIPRDISRNPLFDVLFNYETDEKRLIKLGEAYLTPDEYYNFTTQYELFLDIYERNNKLVCKLSYAVPLFKEERIKRWISSFILYINQVANGTDIVLSHYEMLSDLEKKQVFDWGCGIKLDIDGQTITNRLINIIQRQGEHPAIWFKGEEISFQSVEHKACLIAGQLEKAGAMPGDIIGIVLPRTPELLISIMAILKVGCAWLPMDITYPMERLHYMIENSSTKLIITDESLKKQLDFNTPLLIVNDCDSEVMVHNFYNYRPTDLAYVIYTSGSTGKPKGVQLEHGALINFVLGMAKALNWPYGARTACFTTPCFDIFILETLLCWGHGGCIVLAGDDETINPDMMKNVIINGRTDCLQLVPARLQLLGSNKENLKEILSNIKLLIVGGEAFPKNMLPIIKTNNDLQIFNVYGPTETCVWSTSKKITDLDSINIGVPIANTTIYILDRNKVLLPPGEIGDLWIGGLGVARGYINNAELTDSVFNSDPYLSERMYKTGDLAKWVNGELVFQGRNDGQVKIRGHRIEISEIEQTLLKHPKISNAVVIMQTLENYNQVLVTFFQPKLDTELDKNEIKKWLLERLPQYMVSDFFVKVSAIPQTQNGKIDRKSLTLSMDVEPINSEGSSNINDETENKILGAWKNVLGDISINIHDKFFDVGGNSFSIVLLQEELEKTFPDAVTVTDLFANPTVLSQKKLIQSKYIVKSDLSYTIQLPEAWFGLNESCGDIEMELVDRVVKSLKELGIHYGLDISETVMAIVALYLSKILNTHDISLWIIENSNSVSPITFSFDPEQDLDHILLDVKELLLTAKVGISLDKVTKNILEERSVKIGFYKQLDTKTLEMLRKFDIVFGLVNEENTCKLCLEFSEKFSLSELNLQLKQIKKFINHLL